MTVENEPMHMTEILCLIKVTQLYIRHNEQQFWSIFDRSLEVLDMGWRDGSVLKSTSCYFRGPGFDSQHAHGSSLESVTPVSWDLTPSSGLLRHQAGMWYTDIPEKHTQLKCFSLPYVRSRVLGFLKPRALQATVLTRHS